MSDIIKSQMKNFSLRKFAAFCVGGGGGGDTFREMGNF